MESSTNNVEVIAPDVEPGMNFISVDYELVMVNRANERLYGKPVAALLGKKCYQEFEKRDEPCPHCPGRLALATGETHETQTVGLRGDGTLLAVKIRTHPVLGPNNQPTGFIEVVEDITEQKRVESLVCIERALQTALLSAKNVQRALREALNAAMQVEGISWACAFIVDQATGEHNLVSQRNIPPEWLEPLATLSREAPAVRPEEIPGPPRVVEVVPILHQDVVIATLLVGPSIYPEIPPTLKAGLHSLGATTGNAISRIRAEQRRGDAVADLEALIAVAPVATWILDRDGRVTMWNKAAEEMLGWQEVEVVGGSPPFGSVHKTPGKRVLTDKEGRPLDVHLVTAPFRDILGNASTTIVMAQDLTLRKRLTQLEDHFAGLKAVSGGELGQGIHDADGGGNPASMSSRVLILDSDESWGHELAEILSDLGYMPVRCASTEETVALLTSPEVEDYPFVLTIVGLVTPTGSSGLSHTAALRSLGLEAPVVVSADADVRGYEQHGIAAVVKRPYEAGAVDQAIREALAHRS